MSQNLTLVAWFLVIVAAIPVTLWLLKRTPLGGATLGRPGTPKVVSVTPLAAQGRLVTVEVGEGEDRLWLVLGVTAGGIRTLHTMLPKDAPASPPPPAATFAQLLGRLKQQPGGPGAA